MNAASTSHTLCTRCVLPDTFPGIRFNGDGVCNYCEGFLRGAGGHEQTKERYRQKFLDILGRYRDRAASGQAAPFDAVVAYSGGKDSTYTLGLLVRTYRLKVLSFTFDNGFLSERALKNIRTVTDTLGVSHVMYRPDQRSLHRAFSASIRTNPYPLKTLERASALCNTCMYLAKSCVLKAAVEGGIPFVAYGWSPGQAPLASSVLRLNPAMIRKMQGAVADVLGPVMEEALGPYLLGGRHLDLLEQEAKRGAFLYMVNPLAFHDYGESRVLDEAGSLGWEAPDDTDANSTNCLINGYANLAHLASHGFHPYAFEIAGLVRNGHMTRDEGLKKLDTPVDAGIVAAVKKRLATADQ
jgi:hypothetical protein